MKCTTMLRIRRFIFCFLLLFNSLHGISNPRCVTDSLGNDQNPIVSTIHGDVMGLRKTEIDRRQNKSVTWTSYNVNSS